MDNPSDVPHAVEVEGNGVEEETKTLTKGTADVTVDLKAGVPSSTARSTVTRKPAWRAR